MSSISVGCAGGPPNRARGIAFHVGQAPPKNVGIPLKGSGGFSGSIQSDGRSRPPPIASPIALVVTPSSAPAGTTGGEPRNAGCDELRLPGAQDLAERRDGRAVGAGGARHVGEVVVVAEVDDALGLLGAGAQGGEVGEVAAVDVGAERLNLLRG